MTTMIETVVTSKRRKTKSGSSLVRLARAGGPFLIGARQVVRGHRPAGTAPSRARVRRTPELPH
jgi:hypothetical protein